MRAIPTERDLQALSREQVERAYTEACVELAKAESSLAQAKRVAAEQLARADRLQAELNEANSILEEATGSGPAAAPKKQGKAR